MGVAWSIVGVILIVSMAWEAFETIVLPRTVSRKIRFTGLIYFMQVRYSQGMARLLSKSPGVRETFLSIIGPLTLVLLIACWTFGIITGFALVHLGIDTPLSGGESGFLSNLYMSAATFFTLGYGDVVAQNGPGRLISMLEAGMGFGILALVISYMPVLYQSFSARERVSLLLDARAGSPPVAGELLRFYGEDIDGLEDTFHDFEHWGAALLESYLSYPILASYRSQHEQLSWLASMTCICDACAYVMAGYRGDSVEMRGLQRQASLTYAMLRHLSVDLAYILDIAPCEPPTPRIDNATWRALAQNLSERGAPVRLDDGACGQLTELRASYEPYVYGLSLGLLLNMPGWLSANGKPASWQTTAWDKERHF